MMNFFSSYFWFWFFFTIISNLNFSFDYKTSEPLSDYCIIEILQELSTKQIILFFWLVYFSIQNFNFLTSSSDLYVKDFMTDL